MDRLLKKLGVEANNDISVIKDELEQKQLEYLDKLDTNRLKVNKTMKEKDLEKEIESDLTEIEEALKTIAWMLKKMNTGLNISKTEDANPTQNNTAESGVPAKDTLENKDNNAEELCIEAGKYYNGDRVKKDYEKAFELFSRAEKLGSSRGQAGVGRAYLYGMGIPQDIARGLELSEKAAAQNDPQGQLNLGNAYAEGLGVTKDETKAVEWYTKAAEQGLSAAQLNLGNAYLKGFGLIKDEAKAVEWFTKAGEQGSVSAQTTLGFLYKEGRGVSKDETLAYEWYGKAMKQGSEKAMDEIMKGAEKGHAKAQYYFGYMYEVGCKYCIRNETYAIDWYRRAAEQGDADAQRVLAQKHWLGSNAAEERKAFWWYTNLAEQGDLSVCYYLGCMYKNRSNDKESIKKAIMWYINAANKGHTSSQYTLGYIYERGKIVTRDEAKAISWFTKAAEQGHTDAQVKLAHLYKDGKDKDYAKAFEWYNKAADQDNSDAYYEMGRMYEFGLGIPKDVIKAAQLYTKAAADDHLQAACHLGYLYEHGIGVTEDKAKADEWYRKGEAYKTRSRRYGAAAEHGDLEAQMILSNYYIELGDELKAFEWCRKAAEQGDKTAQFNLGTYYANGYGTLKDEIKAAEWYTKAAEQGHARAQFNLAEIYYGGEGIRKDVIKAAEWYKKSAEGGDEKAIPRLKSIVRNFQFDKAGKLEAYQFLKGIDDENELIHYLEKFTSDHSIENFVFMQRIAEEEHDPIGYKLLGDMYYYGRGTVRSYKDAYYCYKKTSVVDIDGVDFEDLFRNVEEAINNEMIYNQAIRMLETSSFQQGIDALMRLSDKGYADAQFEIGKMYTKGYRLPKDEIKADRYMRLAKQNNHPEASLYIK